MNWLMYIGGWIISIFLIDMIAASYKKLYKRWATIIIVTGYTMLWIWICWRFIK